MKKGGARLASSRWQTVFLSSFDYDVTTGRSRKVRLSGVRKESELIREIITLLSLWVSGQRLVGVVNPCGQALVSLLS